MKKSFFITLLAIAILAVACQDKEREQQLTAREQALLAKEELFALKEAEYQLLQKMRDSLRASALAVDDTLIAPFILPASIAGQWSSKVVCTESTCTDYVVGDQRTDIWEFGQDSTHVLVKIINGKNLVRVYTGNFDGNQISLAFRTDSAAAKQVDMQVVLNGIKDGKIRGTRAITIDNNCTAKFTVELDRAKIK